MKLMNVLTFTLLLILVSCSAGRQGVTDAGLVIKIGAVTSGSDASLGGAMIFGKKDDGEAFGMPYDFNGGELSKPLNNGTWDFWMVAWDGDSNIDGTLSEAAVFEGKPRCAFSPGNVLDGGEVEIVLSLSNANCAGSTFGNTVNVDTGINYFPHPEFTSCLDNSSVLNYSNFCGQGPEYGQIQSYRIIMGEFEKAPGNPNPDLNPGNTLFSACMNIADPDANAIAALNPGTNRINLPLGDGFAPFATVVRGYYVQNCGAGPGPAIDDKLLSFGLGIDVNGHTSHQSGTSPTIVHRVFIENPVSRICSEGRESRLPYAIESGATNFMNGICNATQFEQISANIASDNAKRFVLFNDIDFGGNFTASIGNPYPSAANTNDFSGFFYGRGKTLSNFGHLEVDDSEEVGLFRAVLGAHIENFKIDGFNLECDDTNSSNDCNQVGIVAGMVNGDTTINNIIVTNSFVEGNNKIGGAFGQVIPNTFTGTIEHIHVYNTEVEGQSEVGGIIGRVAGSAGGPAIVLQKSSFEGEVEADGAAGMGGGIVGNFASSSGTFTIKEVYANKVVVEGSKILGGIAGKMSGTTILEDSYARPFVYARNGGADPRIGGIVGESLSTLNRNFSTLGKLKSGDPAGFIKVGGIAGFDNGSTCTNADTNVSTMFDNQTTADINGGTDNGLGCGRFPTTANFNDIKTKNFFNTTAGWGAGKVNATQGNDTWFLADADESFEIPRLSWELDTAPNGQVWEDVIPHLKRKCAGLITTQGAGTISVAAGVVTGSGTQFATDNYQDSGEANPTFIMVDGLVSDISTATASITETAFTLNDTGITGITSRPYFVVEFERGSGTEADPFQICTVDQLKQLTGGNFSTGDSFYYRLENDLDFTSQGPFSSGNVFPIGTWRFDGNGHIFANTDLDIPGTSNAGLFLELSSGAMIKNTVFSGIDVELTGVTSGGVTWGTLAAQNDGEIENVDMIFSNIEADNLGTTAGVVTLGGLVGLNNFSIEKTEVDTDIKLLNPEITTNEMKVGGLVGVNSGDILQAEVDSYIELRSDTSTRGNSKANLKMAGIAAVNDTGATLTEVQSFSRIEIRNYDMIADTAGTAIEFDNTDGTTLVEDGTAPTGQDFTIIIEDGDHLYFEDTTSPQPLLRQVSTTNAANLILTTTLIDTAANDVSDEFIRIGSQGEVGGIVVENDGDITDARSSTSHNIQHFSGKWAGVAVFNNTNGTITRAFHDISYDEGQPQTDNNIYFNPSSESGTIITDSGTSSDVFCYMPKALFELYPGQTADGATSNNALVGTGTTFNDSTSLNNSIFGSVITVDDGLNREVHIVASITDNTNLATFENFSSNLISAQVFAGMLPTGCNEDASGFYDFTAGVFQFDNNGGGASVESWDMTDDYENASSFTWVFEGSERGPYLTGFEDF